MVFSSHALTLLSEYLEQLKCSQELIPRFTRFYELLIEANQRMNLTRITDPDEFCAKHIWDTLTLLPHIPEGTKTVLDLGTGGGIPGIPLWLARPDLEVTLLDSVSKKLKELDQICRTLRTEFPDVLIECPEILHQRAEDAGRDKAYRETFDLVVARAVGSLPVLLEYCLPLVKRNGVFIAMKGPNYQDEMEGISQIAGFLGAKLSKVDEPILPGDHPRSLLIFDKRSLTPNKLPRAAGVPRKQPLTEFLAKE